jgi:hypothetical protein
MQQQQTHSRDYALPPFAVHLCTTTFPAPSGPAAAAELPPPSPSSIVAADNAEENTQKSAAVFRRRVHSIHALLFFCKLNFMTRKRGPICADFSEIFCF